MHFGLTAAATLSYATPPDGLRLRALNPGPLGILDRELGGRLLLPCGLDRLMVGLRPDGELARCIFGLSACLADRTRPTGRGMETDAHHGIAGDILAWRPSDAGLALRAARLVRLPIHPERAQVIPSPARR
jgi:hypothetical protein